MVLANDVPWTACWLPLLLLWQAHLYKLAQRCAHHLQPVLQPPLADGPVLLSPDGPDHPGSVQHGVAHILHTLPAALDAAC
jgi:hypothetical protein